MNCVGERNFAIILLFKDFVDAAIVKITATVGFIYSLVVIALNLTVTLQNKSKQ